MVGDAIENKWRILAVPVQPVGDTFLSVTAVDDHTKDIQTVAGGYEQKAEDNEQRIDESFHDA